MTRRVCLWGFVDTIQQWQAGVDRKHPEGWTCVPTEQINSHAQTGPNAPSCHLPGRCRSQLWFCTVYILLLQFQVKTLEAAAVELDASNRRHSILFL